MAEEFETVEMEISEDDILYYLVDEDDNEIGFVIEEDGQEVECYYEGIDGDDFVVVDTAFGDGRDAANDDADVEVANTDMAELAELIDGEVVELEIDEDAIDHYLFDEDGNEIGFVIFEDGVEVECYYEDVVLDEGADGELGEGPTSELEAALDEGLAATAATQQPNPAPAKTKPEKAEDHGYLYKMASIVGHKGNQARKKAEVQLDKVRSKAEVGVDKATEAVEAGGQRLKEKKDDLDLGITREGMKETTADLNAIAKEGAETAKELKEAYDDIMDSFGFLMPKGIRRRLP